MKYSDLYRYTTQALGGPISREITMRDLVDQAGEYLVGMHPWHWLDDRATTLDLRGLISVSAATTSGTTLTSTGAFSGYTFLSGDVIDLTAGTGVTLGTYDIASKTDANTIELETAPGDAADVGGRMENNSVALPLDFRSMKSISATDSLVNGLYLTTADELLRKRTNQIEVASSWNYYGTIVYAGAPPAPLLEIWPSSTVNETDAFTMFYKAGWLRGTSDDATIYVPDWIDSLMISIVRAFALGYEEGSEPDRPSMAQHLAEIAAGPLFMAAKRRDGNTQGFYGPLRGGAAQRQRHGYVPYLSTVVAAPS